MKLHERCLIWLRVIKCFFLTFSGANQKIDSPEATVDRILNQHKSLIRFGDGEFGIYMNKSIHYQQWSPELKAVFNRIKEDFEKERENCSYILAVPQKFMTISGWHLMKKRVYVSSWAEARHYFKQNFSVECVYGDSFLFEKKNVLIYSRIWEKSNRHIIFIHNRQEYAALFSNRYKREVSFIQCPPRDAFEQLDLLRNSVEELLTQQRLGAEDVQIVVSAGPAGKALVYEMSQKGYWCIDAGHCWDDPLEGL